MTQNSILLRVTWPSWYGGRIKRVNGADQSSGISRACSIMHASTGTACCLTTQWKEDHHLPPTGLLLLHPLLQGTYTGVRTTILGNLFFPPFLTKTKREWPIPGHIHGEFWPHSLQFALWFLVNFWPTEAPLHQAPAATMWILHAVSWIKCCC